MISGQIIGADAVIANFKATGAKALLKIRAAVERSALEVQAGTYDKLQGPVLKHRSGTLSRSITWKVENTGANFKGIVGSSGVPYAAIHEFGFDGNEACRSKLGKAFTRKMKMPERSYLRSTLTEKREAILARISAAVGEAVE
jgi:phage gpG-like protein